MFKLCCKSNMPSSFHAKPIFNVHTGGVKVYPLSVFAVNDQIENELCPLFKRPMGLAAQLKFVLFSALNSFVNIILY